MRVCRCLGRAREYTGGVIPGGVVGSKRDDEGVRQLREACGSEMTGDAAAWFVQLLVFASVSRSISRKKSKCERN